MRTYLLYLCIVLFSFNIFQCLNVSAGGVYFSGKGSIVPSRYSFSDSSGDTNVSSFVNLDLTAYSKIRHHSLLTLKALTEQKTIITPYRETRVEIGYSRSEYVLFDRPLDFHFTYNLHEYDDKSSDPNDFKGMGFMMGSQYIYNERSQFRVRYKLNQRSARDDNFGFWHHLIDFQNKYTVNRDINLVSGLMYIRNNARSSAKDFIKRRWMSTMHYSLPWNHALSAGIRLEFIDYHDNSLLERNGDKYTVTYRIPLKAVDHEFTVIADRKRFSNISANDFHDISLKYSRRIRPDIHHGIIKHSARISRLYGGSAINEYLDGVWEYYRETPQSNGRRYYLRNRFGGRFWKNNRSLVQSYQHYVEESLHSGIIVVRKSGGMIRAGPLAGLRQRIDPQSRNNSDSNDNPIISNPWSNIFYGVETRVNIKIDPLTSFEILLDYRNFTNYNKNTGTEMIDFALDITHKLSARLNAVADFKFSQNINDLKNTRLNNTIVYIIFKFEYLFDLVI